MKIFEEIAQLLDSKIFYFDEDGLVINADCEEVLETLQEDSIDVILTDPPYALENLNCYSILSKNCPRIMKAGSSLITIVGHLQLPEVLNIFNGKLKFRWIFCLNQESGSHPRLKMGIEVMWKPVLWFVKGNYRPGRGFIKDMVYISSKDGIRKQYFKWQQSKDWAEFFITKLSDEGNIILDPFAGSGTVGIVSKKLGRKFILIEKERKNCEIIKFRLLNELRVLL